MATEVDKVNTGALMTIVGVGTFAMIGISLALVALVRDEVSSEASDKDGAANAQYEALHRAQTKRLGSGVPIEVAMQDVVKELAVDPEAATPKSAPVVAVGGAGGGASAAGVTDVGQSTAGTGGQAGVAAPAPVEMAPKPTWQKDGKLPPTGGAPVSAPPGPTHSSGAATDTPPKTPALPAKDAAPGPAASEHGQ